MNAIPLGAFLDSIPRPLSVVVLLAGYAVAVRWEFRAYMLPDAMLLVLLVYRPSIGLLAWVALLLAVRHVPTLARDLAMLMRLAEFDGWTARAVLFALPALLPDMVIMSSAAPQQVAALADSPVHVPVPGTAVVSPKMTTGDITKDEWIEKMARAVNEKGKYVYSANTIFKANGGHRATVLAMVAEIQQGAQPAQFRQESGGVAPADYPGSHEQ
jgi:DNA-binding beta-propeller fold protein YncE